MLKLKYQFWNTFKTYLSSLLGVIAEYNSNTGSSATILQYSMNLLKGPKNPSRSLFVQPSL